MTFRLFYTHHRLLVSVIAASMLTLSIIVISLIFSQPTHANNQRVITIYNGQSTTTVTTSANTVAEVLKRAAVTLDEKDIVEPGLKTVLTAPSYAINIYRVRPVTIVDGTSKRIVMSAYQSPRTIVKQAEVELYDEDIVTASRPSEVLSTVGDRLDIDRAVPISLTLYGKQVTVRTQTSTVKELLKEKGVTLAVSDQLSISDTTIITNGMSIEVWRNGVQTISQEEPVDFETEKIQNADQLIGYSEIKTAGTPGKKVVTYEIDMRNGQEVSRKIIQSVTTQQPVKQVEIVGAKYKGAYTTPGENETITWTYLLNQGFTREQTAGIMGNLKQEHGFNTTGDGLAQWTGSRRANLMSRPDPYNIYTQLDFLMYELNGGYRKVQDAIKASATVPQAVTIFQNQFERCGVCNESVRLQFAYNILASH